MLKRATSFERSLLKKGLVAFVLALMLVQPSLAEPVPKLNFAQVNRDGFGDRQNSYSWSMAWFKGKVYVGTNRSFYCVERALVDFYFPGLGTFLYADPDIPCPSNAADLDLRAEIWSYKPKSKIWKRVFQSPDDLPNPGAPGKFVAHDIGFRDMVVFTEADGTEALYVSGVSAREFTPGLPPPRILRSTDGVNFKPIPQEPGTFLGELDVNGFRSIASYQGKLYIIGGPGLAGAGMLFESGDPAAGNDHFRQVSPPEFNAFELAVFNGYLYVGVGDQKRGYSVWKTDASGDAPYNFIPVVTDGGGRGSLVLSATSMHPFQGRLYVGSNGFNQIPIVAELIRINSDDSWDVVVGNPRLTSQGFKSPVSGLPDNFGNPFNAHFWRMQEHDGSLYLGTNDASWGFRNIPGLDPFIREEYGFDLFKTTNGTEWTQITRNGFGNVFNFGARTFASTPFGLFLGSANYVTGTEVWLDKRRTPKAQIALPPPSGLEAEDQNGVTMLSWKPSLGAILYRVIRIEHLPNSLLGISELAPDAWAPGPSSVLGKTADSFFQDSTAVPGGRYSYHVQAVDNSGQVSQPSNTVIVPSGE